MTSILTSTKKALGLAEEYTAFDAELIVFINATLSDMNQLGIGPDAGFAITDETQTWEDFIGTDPRYNGAQSLMYLSVRLLFDPPTSPPALMAMEKLRNEAVWRLNIHREDIVHPLPPEDVDVPDEELILDGDPS